MTPTGKILVCRCCGEPLRVVCPTHGTDFGGTIVPDHRAGIPARLLRPGTVRERIYFALPGPGDPPHGSHQEMADRLGVTIEHVRVELSELLRRGLVRRVSRGQYARMERAA
jgi:hypothetical protein